ncbi:MAG: S41 family peptidase [Chloroflexi bacterium]|nr:S41 family peptidase [Chloroflexota bacterium]MQC17440.1 S41 family peptidase [Chloroflexota bacterium]
MSSAARNAVIGLTAVLIAALLVATGFLVRIVTEPSETPAASSVASAEPDGAFDGDLIEEIARVLADEYVDAPRADLERLHDGAILGVFEALDDPHSTYIDPDTFAISRDDFEGAFQGIGATVSRQENYVVIVDTLPDTPAERAGLQPGDMLLAIDGEDAEGWTVERAVISIRGPRGTTVELRIRRIDGSEETFSIMRDDIPVASVGTVPPGGVLLDESGEIVEDIAYIRLRQFSRTTPDELRAELEAAEARGVIGIIIDVRSNPGGLLSETVQIADMFLNEGVVVQQVERSGTERVASASPGTVTDLPVVIVQDEFSASGSELLAAALQELGRATVVGTQSFGKGTVNHAVELSNGGAVYVSIARWLTPDGNQIEGRGVTPDVPVQLILEDIEGQRDVSIYRAINVLRGEPIPLPPSTADGGDRG